jgi:hypothetical protein
MTQKFYAIDSQTIKKIIFSATSFGAIVPAWRPGRSPARPCATGCQIPLQRLLRDRLETFRACQIPNSITATSSKRGVSSLWRTCLAFVGDVSSKSQTNSRRLEFDASLIRGSSCNGIKNPTSSQQARNILTLSRGSHCSGI